MTNTTSHLDTKGQETRMVMEPTSEQAATELLKAQVFAAYQSRKFTAIWELFERQIALNTHLELERVRQQSLCEEICTTLEATNAALVEFVKAEDAWNAHAESGDWDEDDTLYHAMIAARQTLATEHGIPLPGEGVS